MSLIDFIKYKILHLRKPMPTYDWIGIDCNIDDKNAWTIKELGEDCAEQMRELNNTIHLLKNKIKQQLPVYLKENLEEITIGGDLNNISIQYHFKNYNLMNKSLTTDIRSDFAECIQTDKLPDYKIKFADTHFTLIFYLEDYI